MSIKEQLNECQFNNNMQKISYILILFLCLFLPVKNTLVLYLPIARVLPDILIAVTFIFYSISIRFKYKSKLKSYDIVFVVYLLLFSITSLLINDIVAAAVIFQIRSFSLYYFMFIIIRNLSFDKNHLRLVLKILQFVSLVLFVLAIIEKVTSKTLLFPRSIASNIIYSSNYARVYSLFLNPNTFGIFITFVIVLTFYNYLVNRNKFDLVIFTTLFISLVLTMSRSSIIITVLLICSLLVYFIIKFRKNIDKSLIIKLLCVVVIIFLSYFGLNQSSKVYYKQIIKGSKNEYLVNQNKKINDSLNLGTSDRFENTLDDKEVENSLTNGRLYSIKKGIEIFKDYPITGSGFSTFGSASGLNYKPYTIEKYELISPFYSDNQYIGILAETGIIGTLLILSFALLLLYDNRKNIINVLLILAMLWFGLFVNILEVQIATFLIWTIISLNKDEVKN